MEVAQTLAQMPERETEATVPANARRCLVTGEVLPKEDLIRFVLDPESHVVPDLAQKLPGRGLWISADREAIETAAKKNLFSKAAKKSVKVDAALADQVAVLLHKRCLNSLGLARRSGLAVCGQPQVEQELKSKKLRLLFIADNAGSNPLAGRDSQNIAVSRKFNRDELGAALGHEQLVYIGLKAHALTEKLKIDLAHLEKIAAPGLIIEDRLQENR